jgi:hypothetical protein
MARPGFAGPWVRCQKFIHFSGTGQFDAGLVGVALKLLKAEHKLPFSLLRKRLDVVEPGRDGHDHQPPERT